MPSLYIPASLCAASYPSPCGRAPWLLPAAARDGRRAHYCGSRSNTPLLHRHTSLAASSRETTNYTSSRATSEIDEPDDNGKLESPPTSSTRNRTTAMSRSSTVDLGALLPGVAPLAKPKVQFLNHLLFQFQMLARPKSSVVTASSGLSQLQGGRSGQK
ncbi:uncharacterized protein LOC119269972 isoform X3 [Triticum dicoccoides]|uniref:uncharacterized protein LOC119269972 isoform X3 n=1 Tax=Triticum dicoccoides TaxID=85692 RepID=UPI00188F598F|nr:uncharacterized protein LOC119269972 isoform X3 [Triticum dicoccoides]